ncbi:MAG: VOC family protein [Bacteroidia bacterium]|nr:VOC family protein [Bacteroidia bacterium]
MASVSTYLNFPGNTEEAFHFYQSVFGGEFFGGIYRYGDMPSYEGRPPLTDEEKIRVMHIALPILGGHYLQGTDVLPTMGYHLEPGNHIQINLQPDNKPETDRLFQALSQGGQVRTPLQDMFWGGYYGACTDKFGIHWMFNCEEGVSK